MDKDKISSTFSEKPIDSLKCRRENDEIRYEKIDKYPVYVEPFHVDFTGRIFLGILGNHLLNAAGNHSQKRGWGMGALNETHHTWVLSRLSIEMTEMPRQYEHVEIRTWVESVMKLFTNRNFSILRSDETVLGYARSVWAMIDMATRKPCDLLSLYDGDILNYVVTPEENVCPIEGHGRFRFRNPELVRIVETYYSDVDINGHINSIKYIEHILDLFPKQRFEQQGIRRFEIAYKSEAYMGDRLYFYIQATEPDSQDSVDIEVRKDGVDVVCQARVTFRSESCAFGLAADSV
jgi:acyl-ACP thioesterase